MTRRASILIVDDNPTMAKTTADILAAHGYAVHTAASALEALDILRRDKIDLLLTDVIMPETNGVELFVQGRRISPSLMAFLMTAYSADELIQRGWREGVKAVLTKPLDLNLLLALVQGVEAAYLENRP
jgi:CheY-like chemotaxis protein